MNIGVVRTNTMKTIHNYFKKESVCILIYFIMIPYSLKKCFSALLILISRSRILEEESLRNFFSNFHSVLISTTLLSDYAYSMKQGGKLYVVTDVKDLFDWEVRHLEEHPLFERVSEEENAKDPCIKHMSEGTDEA
jgi:hypothetical protein